MDWLADGDTYHGSDAGHQYRLEEDAAGWVLKVLEVLEDGGRMRLIDLRLDASDADEAQEAAAQLVEARP